MYVKTEIDKWVRFHKDWFSFKKPKLVVFYEELKSDLRSCLQQFCQFLKTKDKCTPERIDCVVNNSTGNFYRKKVKENVSPYTEQMLEYVREKVEEVYKRLELCVRSGSCVRHFTVWPIGLIDV